MFDLISVFCVLCYFERLYLVCVRLSTRIFCVLLLSFYSLVQGAAGMWNFRTREPVASALDGIEFALASWGRHPQLAKSREHHSVSGKLTSPSQKSIDVSVRLYADRDEPGVFVVDCTLKEGSRFDFASLFAQLEHELGGNERDEVWLCFHPVFAASLRCSSFLYSLLVCAFSSSFRFSFVARFFNTERAAGAPPPKCGAKGEI